MSVPASGSTGNKPKEPRPAPVRKRMSPAEILSAWLNIFFIVLSFVAWPITFVYGLVVGLWRIRHLLLPFGTRAGRQHFWTVLVVETVSGFFFFAIIQAATKDLPMIVTGVLAGILGVAIASSLAAVAVGRLHDLNMSGWWLLLFYGVPATLAGILYFSKLPEAATTLGTIPILAFVIWAIVALGCQRGTHGPNAYGPEVFLGPQARQGRAQPVPPPAGTIANPAGASPAGNALPANGPPQPVSTTGALPPPIPLASTYSRDVGIVRRQLRDLFSFRGRMEPRRYWICTAIQCAFAGVAWALIQAVTSGRDISAVTYWTLVGTVAFALPGLSTIATTIKRLHDGDLTAWWLPGIGLLLAAAMEALYLIYDHQLVWGGSFVFAIWAASVWQIGQMSGTVGPNRFGPDPIDARIAR